MNITIFNKKYWRRRFGEPRNVRGYITSGREDDVVSLHVHPMGADAMQALPEGERKMKHLEGHGTDILIPANQETGVKGDLLFYKGEWYECTAAQEFDHTLLGHLNYQFCLVPTNSPRAADTKDPPTEDPNKVNTADLPIVEEVEMPPATQDAVGGVMVKDGSGLTVDEEGYISVERADDEAVKRLFGEGGGTGDS